MHGILGDFSRFYIILHDFKNNKVFTGFKGIQSDFKMFREILRDLKGFNGIFSDFARGINYHQNSSVCKRVKRISRNFK